MLKSLPSVVRIPLQFLASAGFATVTIVLCILVLAWSTLFVVSTYGQAVAEYGVYHSWWFILLLVLLGINVIAATLVKLPWHRSQIGFLVVHAGIIVLLIGCWWTWIHGVHGQLVIAEGATSSLVIENSQYFQIEVHDLAGKEKPRTIEIPFRAGPFSWCDYETRLSWFPWRLATRDRGTIYDDPQAGIKLEVLDYMADSELVPVPEVVLETRPAGAPLKGSLEEDDADNRSTSEFEITLSARSVKGHRLFEDRKLTIGSQYQFPTGESVSFRVIDSKPAVREFLDAAPKQPLGPLGQIVLQIVDAPESSPKTYRFSLEEMLKEGIVSIGDTSLRVQVTQFIPSKMQARLAIFDSEKKGVKPRIMLLNALEPIFNLQDSTGEVFGSFWFSATPDIAASDDKKSDKTPSAKDAFFKALQEIMKSQPQAIVDADISMEKVQRMFNLARMPRVDLIQGPGDALTKQDGKTNSSKNAPQLYIRKWDGQQVTTAGPFDPDAKQIEWFAETGRPLRVKVRYTPAEEPGEIVRPIPYKINVSDQQRSRTSQRVQVRLTVGQMRETFWLTDRSVSKNPSELQKTIIDRNQHVNLTLRRNEIELGFGVHLDDFEVEYSPGHTMPTRYASQIDFVQLPKPDEKKNAPAYETDITVEGNRPATFKDPSNGRVYRFFQNSYNGPYQPGDNEFEQFVGGAQKRNSLYFSYFGVSYDPGRFWKYAGCFMIIFGIAIMYYMKAYFFRRFSDRIKR